MEIEILVRQPDLIVYEIKYWGHRINIIRVIRNGTRDCFQMVTTLRFSYEETADKYFINKMISLKEEWD